MPVDIRLTRVYLGMFQASVLGLDKAGNTPFHWACYSGDVDCVKLLLPLSMTIMNQKVGQLDITR